MVYFECELDCVYQILFDCWLCMLMWLVQDWLVWSWLGFEDNLIMACKVDKAWRIMAWHIMDYLAMKKTWVWSNLRRWKSEYQSEIEVELGLRIVNYPKKKSMVNSWQKIQPMTKSQLLETCLFFQCNSISCSLWWFVVASDFVFDPCILMFDL